MAIDFTRQTVGSGYNLSKINTNFEEIQSVLQDALSRTGETPNQMEADLDMNSNDILNAGTVSTNQLNIGGVPVVGGDFSVNPDALLPAGGTDGQILTKISGTDFDVDWQDPDEATQDAVGSILTDSDTIDFTYNDVTPSITAVVKDDSITDIKIDNALSLTLLKVVITRTILKTLDTTRYNAAYLTENRREGPFVKRLVSSLSSIEADARTADTQEGIFVNSTHDTAYVWMRAVSDSINIQWFGAVPDNSTDCAPAIQCAINVAAGRTIYAPSGRYVMNSGVSTTAQMTLVGDSGGAGPGGHASSNCTQFVVNYANATLFTVTSQFSSVFRDFMIVVNPSFRPQGSGTGIRLIAPGTATVASPEISGCMFVSLYSGIYMTRAAWPKMQNNTFLDWINDAITLDTDMAIEMSGGFIENNFFFGNFDNSQRSCIFLGGGYTIIRANEILGAQTGVLVNPANHPAGFVRIQDNTIEEQTINGVSFKTTSNTALTMLDVSRNEFSMFNASATYVSSVTIDDNLGTNYIQDVTIIGNTTRHTLGASGKHYWIGNGKNISIAHNVLEELGANNPTGIQITGLVSNAGLSGPIIMTENISLGTMTKYSLAAVGARIHDHQGMTFASLPTNPGNGSEIFVTDGTFANPVAGGGTGCFAKRLDGAWRGD